MFDPRREARRQLARVPLPDDVEPHELDYAVRKELKSLAKETAELVARHLVVAGRLLEDDPKQALAHARAARALAGRVGVVREANGLVAYAAEEWAEALSELRTARRLTGDPENLAVMADCERALGRPDRALLVTEDPQAQGLSPAARVELMIVASGARRDQGQADAAVVSLQVPALEGPVRAWTARLRYAYADALLDAGREDEARQWFGRAAEVDERGETDADERILMLDGIVFEDLGDDDDEGLGENDEEQAGPALPATSAPVPDDVTVDEPDVVTHAVTDVDPELGDDRAAPVSAPVSAPVDARSDAQGSPSGANPPEAPAVPDAVLSGTDGGVVPQTGFLEVPDSEIPALGKVGTTGLGFVQPAEPTEVSPTPVEWAADAEPDELRLFE